jgi:hypothetical protein
VGASIAFIAPISGALPALTLYINSITEELLHHGKEQKEDLPHLRTTIDDYDIRRGYENAYLREGGSVAGPI